MPSVDICRGKPSQLEFFEFRIFHSLIYECFEIIELFCSKDGFKDGTLDSDGSYYSSATDYTNWDCTHRITAGVGYTLGNVNLSAAYQYSVRKGDFYPFMNYVDNDSAADDNICNAVKMNDKRHQLIFTLGYTF